MNNYVFFGLLILCYMTGWFIVSLIKRRNDVADTAWGLGFILVAWTSFYYGAIQNRAGIITGILVTIWGTRLAWHIHKRNKGKTEDYRYKTWRETWGKWFYVRSYLQVYVLQGFLLFLIAIPILIINTNQSSVNKIPLIIGVIVWVIGFVFESVGDAQLARFIKDPNNKGKLMRSGLWQYTRHPNYFGEITLWWGVFIIGLSVQNGIWGIIGPLTITLLITKISGIPLLEKKMAENPEFEAYKKETSILIPLPKRKVAEKAVDK